MTDEWKTVYKECKRQLEKASAERDEAREENCGDCFERTRQLRARVAELEGQAKAVREVALGERKRVNGGEWTLPVGTICKLRARLDAVRKVIDSTMSRSDKLNALNAALDGEGG